ncbi:hypothetical protein chiPu_0026124 [Chiloscyllium punctatum]|uniref:Uncharacterized protein n=1 Tax=Chiloscyllium punctatum TaxID=137246 RepID=A0A401THM6_CHIPU|nr:hypothetical protein [Chiloscyllium punctatum]
MTTVRKRIIGKVPDWFPVETQLLMRLVSLLDVTIPDSSVSDEAGEVDSFTVVGWVADEFSVTADACVDSGDNSDAGSFDDDNCVTDEWLLDEDPLTNETVEATCDDP